MWRRTLLVSSAVLALSAAPASAEPLGRRQRRAGDLRQRQAGRLHERHRRQRPGAGEEIIGIDFRANPIGVADAEAAKQLFS